MNKLKSTLLILAASLVCALPLAAQPVRLASTGGNSPHETTSQVIDSNRVTVTYGRPFSKDPKSTNTPPVIRKIWGTVVPYGKAWRMGSDEATLLITQQPISIGDTVIPAGAFTLFMVPNETGASKLAFSKQIGQWGILRTGAVDETGEFARVDLKKEDLDKSVDQFTMTVDKNPTGGGVLKMMWEKTQYSVAFTVKK